MTAVLPIRQPVNLSKAPPGDPRQPTGWGRRAMSTLPDAPHQIRMSGDASTDILTVACNCGRLAGTATTAPQALALYRAHLPAEPEDVAATNLAFSRPWQGIGRYNGAAAHNHALAQAEAEARDLDRGRSDEDIAEHWGLGR